MAVIKPAPFRGRRPLVSGPAVGAPGQTYVTFCLRWFKLEEEESVLATWVAQKLAQRKLIVATDGEINQKIYEDLKGEEELYGYKKKKAEELLRLQADSFHNVQTKGLK